jgi:hypothetical protein
LRWLLPLVRRIDWRRLPLALQTNLFVVAETCAS